MKPRHYFEQRSTLVTLPKERCRECGEEVDFAEVGLFLQRNHPCGHVYEWLEPA